MKKSELTSPLCNQTLFQLLLSLNENIEHKLAAKPLWQAHLVSQPPPPCHRIWINPESSKYSFHRVWQGRHHLIHHPLISLVLINFETKAGKNIRIWLTCMPCSYCLFFGSWCHIWSLWRAQWWRRSEWVLPRWLCPENRSGCLPWSGAIKPQEHSTDKRRKE